jgi:hypothetical protein
MHFNTRCWAEVLVLFALLLSSNEAFTPRQHSVAHSTETKTKWQIGAIIKGEEENSIPFDVGEGGVRLAEQTAIKIAGIVKHKPGKADCQPNELIRYNNLIEVKEGAVTAILQTTGSKILGTGSGTEQYTDPGQGTLKEVKLGPMEAIKDALAGVASAIESDKLVMNFLGGDDLMMMEVLEAANQMVLQLDAKTKAEISFNSLCHSSIPSGTCTVALVSVGDQVVEGKTLFGEEKSIARGEVYFRNGKWWTVAESDINTSLA